MSKQSNKPAGDDATKRRLESIAAAVGMVLFVVTVGVIVWDGVRAEDTPALITLEAGKVHRHEGSFVVDVIAKNGGDVTAAELRIEGSLRRNGATAETSEVTFDYVPSRSQRRGGMYFKLDPSAYELELRAKGYREP